MRKIYHLFSLPGVAISAILLFGFNANAQTQLVKENFVVYGFTGVSFNQTNTIVGNGDLGSNGLIQTSTGNVFGRNIFSGSKITLGGTNTVNGQLIAANGTSLTGTILQTGSGSVLKNGLVSRGNIVHTPAPLLLLLVPFYRIRPWILLSFQYSLCFPIRQHLRRVPQPSKAIPLPICRGIMEILNPLMVLFYFPDLEYTRSTPWT
jgi:hypothetical protein